MNQTERELAQHMIECLQSPNRKLTQWELDFLTSIGDQFEERNSLSERQFEVLKRVYKEKAE